jgi:uncharacterized protein HemX
VTAQQAQAADEESEEFPSEVDFLFIFPESSVPSKHQCGSMGERTMLYASLVLNVALLTVVGYVWLKKRDEMADSERTAREFELMLQAHQADQRTELLRLHALLMQERQQRNSAIAANHTSTAANR